MSVALRCVTLVCSCWTSCRVDEAEELPPWIYTDAASEPSGSGQTVSIGGVFCESSSLRPSAFFSK
eukprot:6379314-Amphidinium_carterae.1